MESFGRFIESSLQQLRNSAISSFLFTSKRQHSTDTIRITQLNWTPFIGVRTLFLKGLAENFQGGGGEYHPMILFKNVVYHPAGAPGSVEIVASDGHPYFLDQLSVNDNHVLLRCDCGDFKYRFRYADSLSHSLYGALGKPYQRIIPDSGRPQVNPTNAEGMCKHLLKFAEALKDSGLVI